MRPWTEVGAAASRFVRDRYLTLDLRVLGVFRIGFGILMLADVMRRLLHSTFFYSNEGVLSNHFSLFAPLARPYFSVYVAFSTPEEVKAAFLVTALVFAAYALGYRTKIAQVLSFVLYTSLNSRNLFVENGGTVVIGIIAAWTMFLPLGRRYSIDALIGRPGAGHAVREDSQRYVSLVGLAIALQIATIYGFNVAHKTGTTWREGSVIHYILWQNRIATHLAAWLRMHEPGWLSPMLSRVALCIEGAAPALVLSPWARKYTRTTNFLTTAALHAGIALLMSIGPFSYAMIALNFLLLPGEAADWTLRRLAWATPYRARWIERWRAAFPPVAAGDGSAGRGDDERRPAKPWIEWRREVAGYGREGCVLVLMIASASEVLNANAAVPPALRLRQPEVLGNLIHYPRILQGWGMFAPEAPRDDGTIVVDGETVDHRRLDPFTGAPPDFDAPLHGPWYMGSLYCDYFLRISFGPTGYYEELKKYLANWQSIEGRPQEDRLTSFHVYWVTNDSPPPGDTTPRNIKRRLLFSSP